MDDTAIIEILVQHECDMQIAFRNVFKLDYGIVWAPHAPEEIKTKMDYGLLKAFETKSQYVLAIEALESFGPGAGCPVNLDQSRITVNEVAGLWIIWLCFLAVSFIIFLTSFLLKHYCRINPTPLSRIERQKRRNDVGISSFRWMFSEIQAILARKLSLLLWKAEFESWDPKASTIAPDKGGRNDFACFSFENNREDNITPISPKKTSRLQSLLSSIVPRSPKHSDSSFPTIITLESPKSTSAFRKELNNAAKRLNKDSLVQFSKEKMNNLIIQFATRQTESITERAKIIRTFSNKFNLEPEPMRRRFIIPKANSHANLLQAFTSALSKKKQPKSKLLNELLISIIKLLLLWNSL